MTQKHIANFGHKTGTSVGEMSDRPLPMQSWEAESINDLGFVYERKASDSKEEVNTVWQSMYEVGLKRKVSQWNYPPKTPPASPVDEAEMSATSNDSKIEKKDFAAVHRQRAMNSGLLRKDHGREWRKRTYSSPPSLESVQRKGPEKQKEGDNSK